MYLLHVELDLSSLSVLIRGKCVRLRPHALFRRGAFDWIESTGFAQAQIALCLTLFDI